MLSLTNRESSNSLSKIRTKLSRSNSHRYQNFFKPKCAINFQLLAKPDVHETLKPLLSCSSKSIRMRAPIAKKSLRKNPVKSMQINSIHQNLPESIYENLNNYEKDEVLSFQEVFYAGTKDNKLIPDKSSKNLGYDGENGNYRMIKGDHLNYRYEIKSLIGQGTFGVVCECFDHKFKKGVAIKIIRNKKSFNKQAAIEIRILETVREYDVDNQQPLIKLQDHFVFRNHVFLVFDLLSVSLYEFEKMNRVQGLKEKQVKSFVKQILQGLIFLKSLNIIHCDLKPENILLTSSTCKKIKIIDFGSSCFSNDTIHTYIQSRYYRSPEVILGFPYTEAIDMWSLGCILVELIGGKVLFRGENEVEMMMLIINLLGYPPEYLLKESKKTKLFFHKDGSFRMNNFEDGNQLLPGSHKPEWQASLVGSFIQKCLVWDPQLRLTPEKALEHPWLNKTKKTKISKLKILKKK